MKRQGLDVLIRWHAIFDFGYRRDDHVNSSQVDFDGGRLEDYITRFDAGQLGDYGHHEGATAIWVQLYAPDPRVLWKRPHLIGPRTYSRQWQVAFETGSYPLALDPEDHMLKKERDNYERSIRTAA